MKNIFTALLIVFSFISCSSDEGEIYPEITFPIGQTWMVKNLDVDVFRNGDPILKVESFAAWDSAIANNQPAWCYVDFDPIKGAKYGKIYNYHAVNNISLDNSIAPEGYHIPTETEWLDLIEYLGGENLASKKMASTSVMWVWDQFIEQPNNESGFDALPGGELRSSISGFKYENERACWWNATNAKRVTLRDDRTSIDIMNTTPPVVAGYFVRCIKDY